jgi:hypothetical protein
VFELALIITRSEVILIDEQDLSLDLFRDDREPPDDSQQIKEAAPPPYGGRSLKALGRCDEWSE